MKYKGLHIPVPSEHSCVGRCGYHELGPESCRCDPECELFRDCCIDYFDTCSTGKASAGSLNTTMFTCVTLKDNPYTILTSVLLVAKCPSGWKELGIRRRCEMHSHDDFTFFLNEWPVFDHFGNNFRNIFCAICNGHDFRNVQPWDVNLSPLFNTRQMQTFRESSKCENETKKLSLGKVGKQLRFCFPSLISRCPPSYNNESISSACLAYSANMCPTSNLGQNFFKNSHCAACNGFVETFPPCSTSGEGLGVGPFLKSIWAFKAVESNEAENTRCLEGNQLFDPYLQQCRSLSCHHDLVPRNISRCSFQLEITSDVTDMCCERQESWILFKTDDPTGRYLRNEIIPCFLDVINISEVNFAVSWKLKQFMGQYIGHILIQSNNAICNMAHDLDQVFTDHAEGLVSCRITSIEYLYMGMNIAQGDSCDGLWLNGIANDFKRINGSELGDVFMYEGVFIIPQTVLNAVSYIWDETEQKFTTTQTVYICGKQTRILTCPFITLFSGDLDVIHNDDNRTITLRTINTTLDEPDFVTFPDGRILICADSLFKPTAKLFLYLDNLDLVNTIGSTVSLVSLVALFLLLAIYRDLQNFHGRCVMKLTVALFAAQFIPMISTKLNIPDRLCVAFAILAHYAWLASFAWMTIIGINLFHLFIYRPMTRREDRESTRLFRIIFPILGWSLPSIISTICVCLHFVKTDNLFFEYGSISPCWITNPMANLLGFGVPVGISLGINIILYPIIVFKSCGQQRRSRELQERNPNIIKLRDVVLCLKVN